MVNLPSGPPEKEALARLIDAENAYYEAFADPGFVRVEAARLFRGQYLRRLRRLAGAGVTA